MSNPVPLKALLNHIAIIGKTGSGKTWAARGIVEGILDDDGRACIIDPTGVWWGLKSNASGERAGYPVVIFGGTHSDFPLGAQHGDALAEIVGTSSTSSIIDTSQMKTSERSRFFTDFADGLVRKNKGPLHLVIDEAHLFAPQGRVNDPQSGAMLHAANNLVSLGRARGLRIMLITQRPAKLHKDSLTQVETLIAMRLMAPQDRHAVEEWIEDNADSDGAKTVISSLAGLQTGEGWIWAPTVDLLTKVKFPKISTFDTGQAPDGKSGRAAPVLAPIDHKAIAERLKTVAAETMANDPAALRKRIIELEKQLRGMKTPASAPPDSKALLAAEARGERKGWQEACAAVQTALKQAQGHRKAEPPPAPATAPQPRKHVSNGSGEIHLPPGERATLAAVIQYQGGLKREQLSILTGYKRSSRDAYIQRLREKGFIEVTGELVKVTLEGMAALPDAEPLPTGQALQDFWMHKLPAGEAKILGLLMQRYPDAVPRDELDEPSGFARSSRDAYLQRLRARELIEEPTRGTVKASETLFN